MPDLLAGSIFGTLTQRGLVELQIGGVKVQMTPSEAREYAATIYEAAAAAETDEFLMTWLKDRIGFDGVRERLQVLQDFRKMKDEERQKMKDNLKK